MGGTKPRLAQATLPSTARVLFCMQAFSAFDSYLSPELARRILTRCVLVHEHFHAIMETGVTSDGSISRGLSQRNAWDGATPLHEALGAWMELYYVRRHAGSLGTEDTVTAVQEALWAYIRSGPYPH